MKRPHQALGRRPGRLAAVLALVVALALAPLGAARASHGGAPGVPLTEPAYLKWLIDSRQPVVVVDLRPPSEFRAGHLPGALSVPMAELDRRYGEIPTSPMVVLYCRCPLEEAAAAYAFLETKGYVNHVVLREGLEGWLRRGYPIQK